MEAYLTPAELEIAKQNGIPVRMARKRYDEYFWTKEKAITHPPRYSHWEKYQSVCLANGVSRHTFHKRIRKGMEPEKAAATPPTPFSERYKGLNRNGS